MDACGLGKDLLTGKLGAGVGGEVGVIVSAPLAVANAPPNWVSLGFSSGSRGFFRRLETAGDVAVPCAPYHELSPDNPAR